MVVEAAVVIATVGVVAMVVVVVGVAVVVGVVVVVGVAVVVGVVVVLVVVIVAVVVGSKFKSVTLVPFEQTSMCPSTMTLDLTSRTKAVILSSSQSIGLGNKWLEREREREIEREREREEVKRYWLVCQEMRVIVHIYHSTLDIIHCADGWCTVKELGQREAG